jgi:hypothetical protein
MPTTPNFGWNIPADTDYVTNGALSIRTLGNDADYTVNLVQTNVNTLSADKVNKSGDTMTGALSVRDGASTGKALQIRNDGSGAGIVQFTNADGTVQTGYIVSEASLVRISNGNTEYQIKADGNTSVLFDGENRPIPFATNAGYVTGVAANTAVSVSFDSGRFTEIPIVMITPVTTATTATTGHVGNLSTSSFTLYNTTNATRNFFWQAIQMVENSAAG